MHFTMSGNALIHKGELGRYFTRPHPKFSLPLIHSRRVVVSYKRKYVHELLVNCVFKPAQEKVWLGELTVPP